MYFFKSLLYIFRFLGICMFKKKSIFLVSKYIYIFCLGYNVFGFLTLSEFLGFSYTFLWILFSCFFLFSSKV